MERHELIDKLNAMARGPKNAVDYNGNYSVLFFSRDDVRQITTEAAVLLETCFGCAYCFRMEQERADRKAEAKT